MLKTLISLKSLTKMEVLNYLGFHILMDQKLVIKNSILNLLDKVF